MPVRRFRGVPVEGKLHGGLSRTHETDRLRRRTKCPITRGMAKGALAALATRPDFAAQGHTGLAGDCPEDVRDV
jgi:hypothetical protein